MLLYKEMDATGINTGIIAHGVNCQRKMASGIAKTIREKFPDVYRSYMQAPSGPEMLGSAHVICVNHDADLYVANMYTQVFYGYGGGKYADPDAIVQALESVIIYSDVCDQLPIFMPRIGCGLGGLDWDRDVVEGVQRVADKRPDIDIIVCDLPE
jgi:O-acetyl-ADP-ribose deacetylase (regulator of RNase III)